jgi:hypothetical protein
MTACAVPGAPPHASIYPKGHHELANDPGYVLEVELERHIIKVDIQGERYTGELRRVLGYPNSLQSRLLTRSGSWMECALNQLLPEVWDGECTDSQGHLYDLKVGSHWSV